MNTVQAADDVFSEGCWNQWAENPGGDVAEQLGVADWAGDDAEGWRIAHRDHIWKRESAQRPALQNQPVHAAAGRERRR